MVGWYLKIALKRRFKIDGVSEEEFLRRLAHFCSTYESFTVSTKGLVKPERMPVSVIEVVPTPELINFHLTFIAMMGKSMASRYPERDGANYFPHVTAQFNNTFVIDTDTYVHRNITISRIWLLKDMIDENSRACAPFELKKSSVVGSEQASL